MTALEDLGARIRTLREAVNLRQQDLAVAAGLSRTSVTNIEAGRQDTTATTLLAIADALGVPVGDLFGAPATGPLPSVLAARVTGGQQRITGMLVEMANLLGRMAEESDKRHVELAALVGQPADPEMAAKVITDPTRLADGLDLTDEERQRFLDSLSSCRECASCRDLNAKLDDLTAMVDRIVLILDESDGPAEEQLRAVDAVISGRRVDPDARYAAGWRDAVATLRDDARYRHWWTARDYPPDQRYWETEPRNHLADYLRTVGPDGPEVTPRVEIDRNPEGNPA